MNYKLCVIDLETSIKNRGEDAVGKMKASPHCPENNIVWDGNLFLDAKGNERHLVTVAGESIGIEEFSEDDTYIYFIGQNIKFDLLYYMHVPGFREYAWQHCKIWDTMLAEYLITGQDSKMVSLDKLAEKYGGTLKDDRLKDFWENNIDTEDIPDEIIKPYLENDLRNTHIVFLEQVKRARELGIMPLIESQMKALKTTTEMEYNGMHFDTNLAGQYADELREELEYVEENIRQVAKDFFEPEFDFNPLSNQHLQTLLFGGDYWLTMDVPVRDEKGNKIYYKTGKKKGQVKTRKEKQAYFTEGWDLPAKDDWETKTGISVADGVLNDLLENTPMPDSCKDMIERVLTMRKIKKDLSTYFEGYSALTWPHDHCIHPSFNHCVTETGRLSSSAPNLQNASGGEE